MIKGPPPKKRDPNAVSNARRLQQAWSLVGCVNAIAVLLLAFIFFSISGYTLEVKWTWIVGGAVLVVFAAITMIRQMSKQTKS